MKNVKKRAVGLLLTAALLASALLPAGCKSRESKDIEQIKEVTEQFFEAYASGNTKDMEDLVDGDFSYNFYDDDKDKAEVVFKVASKTEIEEFKSIEVDRKNLRVFGIHAMEGINEIYPRPSESAIKNTIQTEDEKQKTIYNLHGQKMDGHHLPQGLYVSKGRKFVTGR